MAVRSSVLRPPVIRTTGMGGKVMLGRKDVICSGGSGVLDVICTGGLGRSLEPSNGLVFILITISPLQHS